MAEAVAAETYAQKRQERQPTHTPRIETTYIDFDLDIDGLTPEKRELFNKIQEFAQDTAERYREKLSKLMTYYAEDIGQDVFTPEIIEKMKKRGMTYLVLRFMMVSQRKNFYKIISLRLTQMMEY